MDKFCEDCIHNEVCQYYAIPPHKDRCNDKDTLDDLIPQGEWIIAFHDCTGKYYLCSSCKEGRAVINGEDYASLDEFKFCPHCGAKMQKGGTTNDT